MDKAELVKALQNEYILIPKPKSLARFIGFCTGFFAVFVVTGWGFYEAAKAGAESVVELKSFKNKKKDIEIWHKAASEHMEALEWCKIENGEFE